MSEHAKLVRDRIPEIIAASGRTCRTAILDDGAYLNQLHAKLHEELAEYLAADSDHALEELADLTEVIRAVAAFRGYSPEALEEARARKAAERGGFAGRVMLYL